MKLNKKWCFRNDKLVIAHIIHIPPIAQRNFPMGWRDVTNKALNSRLAYLELISQSTTNTTYQRANNFLVAKATQAFTAICNSVSE